MDSKEENLRSVRGLIAKVFAEIGIQSGDNLLVRRGDDIIEISVDPIFGEHSGTKKPTGS